MALAPIDWFPRSFSVEQLASTEKENPDFTFGARRLQARLLMQVTALGGKPWTAAALGDDIGGIQQALVSTPSPDHLLVVSGGLAYWVPTKDPGSWQQLGAIPVVALTKGSKDLLLVSDFTGMQALGPKGPLWRTDRVSLDGFEILSVDEARGNLLGQGYNPHISMEGFFTVSLATGVVTLLPAGGGRPSGGSPPLNTLSA